MNEDTLRSAWHDIGANPKSNAEIKNMMQGKSHPVLKRIRKQLIVETAAFTVFLFVYYDFFDGRDKPLYANILLVASLLFVIMHNMIGYTLTRQPVTGNTIKQSLTMHLARVKNFAVISVTMRVLSAVCLLLFFTSTVTFTDNKYRVLAVIIFIFIIQIAFLFRIWTKRISELGRTINNF